MVKLKTTREERAKRRFFHETLDEQFPIRLIDDCDALEAEVEKLQGRVKTLQTLSNSFAFGLIVAADMLGPVSKDATTGPGSEALSAEVSRLRAILREFIVEDPLPAHNEYCETVLQCEQSRSHDWDHSLCDCSAGRLRAEAKAALGKKP